MNVGAIGAYSPISYVNPYATNVNTSQATGQVESTSRSGECQTCANRKYQDGSNENDVSFKTASKVAPEAAGAAIRSHEQMHVKNAFEKAEEGNGKVISASVQIQTSCCPECGKTYVSGGTTRTTIQYANESNPYQKNLKNLQGDFLRGINLDMKI